MENNINRSEKKKSRFNIIDALVIIIAFLLAALVFLAIDPFDLVVDTDKQTVVLRYTVEFDAVDNDVAKNIALEEGVSNANTVLAMGVVKDVSIQQAYVWEMLDGEMVKKDIAGKSRVFVTVEVECTYKDGVGYFVNGQQIAVGTSLQLRFADFVGSGYCVSLETVTGEVAR